MRTQPILVIENASQSNPSAKPYRTLIYADGGTSCNCRGWIFSGAKRGCRHTKAIKPAAVQAVVAPMLAAAPPTIHSHPRPVRKFRVEVAHV